MKMKVLHVIDQLNAGGAERVCIDLVNLSHQHGLSVGVLVLLNESNLDSMIDPTIFIHYLGRNSKFNIRKYFEVASIAKQYDIIHIHMRHVYRYMIVVKVLTNLKNKFILHDHFGDIRTQKQIPFLFDSLFKPQYYIGVSKELTTWAVQDLKMDERKVFLLANIVRRSSRKIEATTSSDIVIVSNIRQTKNIDFAIRLALSLNLKIDIIGQVVDPLYYKELQEIIKTNNAEEQVSFIHDCYNVQSRLYNYRMALHTASSETGPLVLMEYLAQGTNFLSYRTGEVAAVLGNVLPEFFIDTFGEKAWKERMIKCLANPVDKETLISIFEQNFNEETYSDTCLRIYQSILRY